METEFTCFKCRKAYEVPSGRQSQETSKRVPRLARCLHTVCEVCMSEASRESRSYHCQQCGTRTALSAENAVLRQCCDWSLIKRVDAEKEEKGERECEQCAESRRAGFWCVTCGEALCGFHRWNHSRSRKTACHQVQRFNREKMSLQEENKLDDDEFYFDGLEAPGADGPDIAVHPKKIDAASVLCSEHKTEEVRWCCPECGAMACRECRMEEHHCGGADRNWIPIEEARKHIDALLNKMQSHADLVASSLKKCADEADAVSERLEAAAQRARTKVRDTMDKIRTEVARREAALLGRLDEYLEQSERLVSAKRRLLARSLDDLALVSSTVSQAEACIVDETQKFAVTAAIEKRLTDLTRHLDNEALLPPDIDTSGFRVDIPDTDRIIHLLRGLGLVRRPDDPEYDDAEHEIVPDANTNIDLVIRAVQPNFPRQPRFRRLPPTTMKHQSPESDDKSPPPPRHRSPHSPEGDGDSDDDPPPPPSEEDSRDTWVVEVRDKAKNILLARVFTVDIMESQLAAVVQTNQLLETGGEAPPSLRITRRFAVKKNPYENHRRKQHYASASPGGARTHKPSLHMTTRRRP